MSTGKRGEPFWSKIAASENHEECWEWQRRRNPQGYGILKKGGKSYRAHRCAWEALNGPIPQGMHVLHKCDNPPCCNPSHLFLGTNADNIQDMIDKGRDHYVGPGEQNRSAKLTAAQVSRIREMYASGDYSHRELGEKFGVSRSQIGLIINRKNWIDA